MFSHKPTRLLAVVAVAGVLDEIPEQRELDPGKRYPQG